MTNTERDDHQDEVDPTGVRALLSSLPDPGPMPADLVSRINASLAAETAARATGSDSSGGDEPAAAPPQTPAAGVISLSEQRRRRRPARTISLLAGAAAVAVAATVAVSQMLDFDDGGPSQGSAEMQRPETVGPDAAPTPAPPPMDAEPEDDEGAEAPTPNESFGINDDPGDEPFPPGGGTMVALVPGVVDLTHGSFEDEVRSWYNQRDDARPQGEVEAPTLNTLDALDCAESVPLPGDAYLAVGAATFDGQDAILMVQGRPGPRTAWVLPLDCVRGPAEILHGPVAWE